MELVPVYVDLCRRLGGYSDWIQGAGGNFSIKQGDDLIVKASGVRICDTTESSGYVVCSIAALKECIARGEEDSSSALRGGAGKPSIEAFFHVAPAPIVVHLHPSHMLTMLCDPAARTIPYCRPGLSLAHAFLEAYSPQKKVYFLQNHGIILCGSTVDEIMDLLAEMEGWTNITITNTIYEFVKSHTGKSQIVKSFKGMAPREVYPYTPDMAVFLQSPLYTSEVTIASDITKYVTNHGTHPTIVCDGEVTYIVAPSLSKCYDIYEILVAHTEVDLAGKPLPHAEVYALNHWDKEILRKSQSS